VGLKFVSGALGATVRLPPTILGSVPESDEELIPSLPPSKNIVCDIARLRHSPSHAAGGGCRLGERKGWRRTAKHVSARAVRWSRLRQCGRLASCTGSCGKQGIGSVDHGRRSRDGVIGQAPSYPAQSPCNTSTMSGSTGETASPVASPPCGSVVPLWPQQRQPQEHLTLLRLG